MVMLANQAKVTHERFIQLKGWNVERVRDTEVRDPIHDTIIDTTEERTTIKCFISAVTENHSFVIEGFLAAGDAIASFTSDIELQLKDQIEDPKTGKTYEVVKLWKAGSTSGIIIGTKAALKWQNK